MKKVFFGLAVAAIALAGSAFTNVSKSASGDVYGNLNTSSDTYTVRTEGYEITDCISAESAPCAYIVTPTGASHLTASSYTQSELEAFLVLGYVAKPAQTGVYNGL